LARGGQNPVEAIAARIPVVFGPDMTNFADLVTLLNAEKGVWQCEKEELAATLSRILTDKAEANARKERAYKALSIHSGATQRSVELVASLY
jgi:3-deoxy-D-manno-octulosonic-acid transferase